MSTDTDDVETERTPEEKLKALIKKDLNPEVTRLAKRALKRRQEGSS